jgi:hypothetical protein
MDDCLVPLLQQEGLRGSTRRVIDHIVERVKIDTLLTEVGHTAERIVATSQRSSTTDDQNTMMHSLLDEALGYLGEVGNYVRRSAEPGYHLPPSTIIGYLRSRNIFEQLTLVLCATVDFLNSDNGLLSRLSRNIVNLLLALLAFDQGIALVITELAQRVPLDPTTKGTRLYLWAEVPCLNRGNVDETAFYTMGSRLGHSDLLREEEVDPTTLLSILTGITTLGCVLAALDIDGGDESRLETTSLRNTRALAFVRAIGATRPFRTVSRPPRL